MTDGNESRAGEPFMPRWVLYLVLPGAIGPLLIFLFIVVTERAHGTESCPYRELGRREVAPGVLVVEDARRCLDNVEDRRYRVLRGPLERVLGSRRFEPAAFEGAAYRWQADLVATGEVTVQVYNPGHPPAVFREGTEEERRTGRAREIGPSPLAPRPAQ
jgi:hypothetical protein